MDKKFNLWFIILGFIFLTLEMIFANNINTYSTLTHSIFMWSTRLIHLVGTFLISFGIINYTKFRLWIKLILIMILMIFISFLWIFAFATIYGV